MAMGRRFSCRGLLTWVLACCCAVAAGPVAAQPRLPGGAAPPEPAAVAPVLAHYAALVHATYEDTVTQARALQDAVRRLVAQPSAPALAAAREAWVAARERYALSEAFRFYGGPIDGDDGPEPRLNTWPVDESYIDAIVDPPRAARVLPLERRTLVQLNLRDGEENVATGWHAIEYLLWGADRSASGPGQRPHTDYVAGQGRQARRRGRYLVLVTALLLDDLADLQGAWAPGTGVYRHEFEHAGALSLRRIVTGLGLLARAELAGERLEVPLASQDQEDEQSCFSDTTHHDIVGNVLGIENVWLGRYQRLDGALLQGASLQTLVAQRDPVLADRVARRIAQTLRAAQGLQPPFDQEILGDAGAPGRQRVRHLIDSVNGVAAGLADAARALGLQPLHRGERP